MTMLDSFGLKNLIDTTDKTVLRCYENGIAVPTAWVTYRAELRALIAAGGISNPPTQPPYPAGT